jgi:signal transduction histidine kinase
MWFVNIYLLMLVILQLPQSLALISGFLAGFLIFTIERSIIMANGSKAVLVFRIVLGFFIALLGSATFDEVLFKTDIDQQLIEQKMGRKADAEAGIDSIYAPMMIKKNMEVDQKLTIWNNALAIASGEADGTTGSGRTGVSEITKLKLDIAKQKEKDYLAAKTELDSIAKRKNRDRLSAMAEVESNFSEHAMLQRISAMFELVFSNRYMGIYYGMITAILFMMEFMVVILKFCLPRSNYEIKIETIEKIGQRRMAEMLKKDPDHFRSAEHTLQYRKTASDVRSISGSGLFN